MPSLTIVLASGQSRVTVSVSTETLGLNITRYAVSVYDVGGKSQGCIKTASSKSFVI
jgi:hypothetical protein